MDDLDALVARARSGDGPALDALFEIHYPRLYRYLVARLGDPTSAEDLASEACVVVAERIRRFCGGGAGFAAWLFTIARHDLQDMRRAAARFRVEPMAEMPDGRAPDDPPSEVERRIDIARLKLAIAELTADQREVVQLKYAGGLSNAEVARILGRPVGAVKSLQHRALDSLRRRLDCEGAGDDGSDLA